MGAAERQLPDPAHDNRGRRQGPFWFDANRIVFSSVNLFGLAVVAPTGGTPSRVPNTILGDSNPG